MVSLKISSAGSVITYEVPGSEAEYSSQMKAVAKAIATGELNGDERQALGHLLVNILPDESQLNLSES